MDPISNSDRLAALLRQRLAERGRTDASGRRESQGTGRGAVVDRIEALGALEDKRGRGARRPGR